VFGLLVLERAAASAAMTPAYMRYISVSRRILGVVSHKLFHGNFRAGLPRNLG